MLVLLSGINARDEFRSGSWQRDWEVGREDMVRERAKVKVMV